MTAGGGGLSYAYTFKAPMEGRATVAKETITRLIDDIDGGKADETVKVGIDGQIVEVDLSTKNAKALRAALQPYITHGTKVKAGPVNGKPRPRVNVDNSLIREWAQAQGYEVAERGRIRKEIVEEFNRRSN